ncbi:uncharacterized protein LOC110752348 [Prunus avium]|uniref:Uncharacterized protein LOC110752348 n=1 Tax=Prunus avium TaxID=42229 RepID=A0A6P5S1X9_PRUAV|nr:uncharacterized protein LOC110752348 [Prunus avium]
MASSTSSLYDSYFSSISNFISVKLDRKNYSCWLAQIVPVLRSRKLMSYVDGSSSCPPPTISTSSSKEGDAPSSPIPNPAYDEWIQKDQLVLSWINGSLHSSVLSTVSRLSTARDTWLSLEKRFASTNPHRLLFLQSELHNTLRGDSSVQEFLDRIKSIADDLGQAGESVSESLLVSLILKNVGPMYETVVSAVLSRGTPITYDELEVLLLSAEKRLQSASVPAAISGVSALVASRGRGGGHRGDSSSNNRGSFSTSRGGGRRGGYTPGSRGSFQFGNGRGGSSLSGHGGFFQPRYGASGILGQVPSQGVRDSSSSYGGSTSEVRQCYSCQGFGHIAKNCPSRFPLPYNNRAPPQRLQGMAAYHSPPHGVQNWVTDTGANAHVTNDLSHLSHTREYRGSDTVAGVLGGQGFGDGEDSFLGQE